MEINKETNKEINTAIKKTTNKESSKSLNKKKIIIAVALILIAAISMTWIKNTVTSADFHASTIESLDEKKATVMKLTGATVAVSTAITMIPGDTATPIANKIADLSSYLLIVLCALYLEKYLLTITGLLTFLVLIPSACVLGLMFLFTEHQDFKALAKKLTAFGLAIFLMVPASVTISNLIEDTYNSSITTTIESADSITGQVDGGAETSIKDKITGTVSLFTTVKEKAENWFSDMVEAIAVMIVTSCLVPVFVLLCFIWLIKALFGVNVSLPKRGKDGV